MPRCARCGTAAVSLDAALRRVPPRSPSRSMPHWPREGSFGRARAPFVARFVALDLATKTPSTHRKASPSPTPTPKSSAPLALLGALAVTPSVRALFALLGALAVTPSNTTRANRLYVATRAKRSRRQCSPQILRALGAPWRLGGKPPSVRALLAVTPSVRALFTSRRSFGTRRCRAGTRRDRSR